MPALTFDLPVSADVDVLVGGGGPTGVAASLSAARSGARVLLVERLGFLGGSATAAQVPAFSPFSDRTRAVVRGIGWEVLVEMLRRTGRPIPDPDVYVVPQDRARMDWVPIDVEVLKCVYDDLCEAAGVEVLFHTFVPEVVREGDRLVGAVLANKNGLSFARARVFVDATGDADLAARAGCPFHQGDETGAMQGMTLCFTVANGSREAYLGYVHRTGDGFLARLVAEARAAGDYDLPDASLVGLSFKNETVAGANLGHVYGHDSTNARSVSAAEREGRRVVQKLLPFLRKYVPGQQDLFLVSTGPHIGVRESRRIVGDYTLTLDDYLACRTFPDDIARCAYFIDLHAVTSEKAARARTISDGDEKKSYALPPGKSHGIPYRCLLPQNVENLLVAGRSLSADRAVQGAARVMPFCFAMGEAAGLAAALAVQSTGRTRDVNVTELQARLRAQGAWLGG
jgi:glycine/D-amino acid oxidase-like deaminating enzyme